MATRQSSAILINRLAKLVPNIIGGSVDFAPSNKTCMKDRAGATLHFGVREHAMAAIANEIYLHGGLKVFLSTFFVFIDYMKGVMRLSAIIKLPIPYAITHDSIGVGEDGATHKPIEQLAALRAVPNMTVFRPIDSKEAHSLKYIETVLPNKVRTRVTVEAATFFGLHKYVGLDEATISINNFGASGKAEVLFEEFGFTVKNVFDTVLALEK